MKFNYAFSNLLGTVYSQGNILFSPDGRCLFSPVGNRVSVFDLINNKSFTLPFETNKNIEFLSLAPNGVLLLAVDEDGRAILANVQRRCILHRLSFKSRITALSFSPCGRFFAVGLRHKNALQIWRTPLHGLSASLSNGDGNNQDSAMVQREFSPFVLHRTLTGHFDLITMIQWSKDSECLLTSSKDMSVRIFTRDPLENFKPLTLAGHRDSVVGAWWSESGEIIYSVSRDGSCFTWVKTNFEDAAPHADKETTGHVKLIPGYSCYKIHQKNFFNQQGPHGPARVKSVSFHTASNLLIVGFTTGVFGLYEMPDFNNIHTLSISQKKIDSVIVSPSGEWLAFASSKLGQLLVWEWQSETYILKQQGHYFDLNCLAYSPDGQHICTGGDDGKIKLWNTTSGFCFVTFSEHTAPITALEFAGKNGGKQGVVFSASMDGTVRAFDLIRYRNFRTFTSPDPAQFNCLAVDPSGEIVCAGSMDTFEIFVWSVQTGRLLDVLSGHDGPISSMAFSPEGSTGSTLLVTGSWDKTVKTWDLFARGNSNKCLDTFQHRSEVLAVAFKPDGKEICTTTLDGTLTFWDPVKGGHSSRIAEIEGNRDIAGGRKSTDVRTAKTTSNDKHFTSLCYSADGNCILAGGNSKWICLYDVGSRVLMKKFQLSKNLSLDGQREKLNSKNMTEAGPMDLIDADEDESSDIEERLSKQNTLPGVQKGDMSERKVRPEIRSKCVRFNPTGRSWATASTEGLVIYSIDDSIIFDPFDLDMDITASAVINAVKVAQEDPANGDWLVALVMAMRLNEPNIIQYVYESIPVDEIELVAQNIPRIYVDRLLRIIAVLLDQNVDNTDSLNKSSTTNGFRKSPHLEFHLLFLSSLLRVHGRFMKDNYHSHVTFATASQEPSSLKDHSLLSTSSFAVILRALKKNINNHRDALARICDENLYTLRYLTNVMPLLSDSVTEKRAHEEEQQQLEGEDDLMLIK